MSDQLVKEIPDHSAMDFHKDTKLSSTTSSHTHHGLHAPKATQQQPTNTEMAHINHDSIEIDYEALPENSPIVAQLAAGAFAGIMEHTVMFPVDAIKTRLQVSSASIAKNESLIQTFSKISASEGLNALWRGVSSVILGAGPAHAVYFMVFENTKTALCDYFLSQKNRHNSGFVITDEKHPLIASLSGIAATVTSDALMNPFDVVKQQKKVSSPFIYLIQLH
ncbi:unnamed protein product [Ambrosiozyma monospora]|uniref:Unnamed protein product n=1 Tax=Ambrosiozyma monospora TaxID=43982 RepID=A0ACB5T9B4_AMBMO|nr:unnamed protein product [Ambrosiozyma monospora]